MKMSSKAFRSISVTFIVIVQIIVILVLLALISASQAFNPVTDKPDYKTVIITPGSGTEEIALMLKENNLIRSEFWFSQIARLGGYDRRIKAGEYRLSPHLNAGEILDKLVKGEVVLHPVTIPEGYTSEQIADLLSAKGFVDKEKFLQVVNRSYKIEKLASLTNLEGYLYPDTYNFSRRISEEQIAMIMFEEFKEKVIPIYRKSETNLSLSQITTLASIIEKEAKNKDERPLISAVFHNRLKRGMKLQACPTVRYAIRENIRPLTYDDLQVDSLFNTYIRYGLPPHPISNPGLDSIRAALEPAEVDYLYFVAKGDGSHHFSSTYSEHLEAVREYRN